MTKFEPGKTYATRSICDHECIIRVTIASRTDKTVTTATGKRFTPKDYNGVEFIRPWGTYSMAPIIGADDAVESETTYTKPSGADLTRGHAPGAVQ